MSNNNTQFNLLYIATKTSKSDPQNDTKFSALENGNVPWFKKYMSSSQVYSAAAATFSDR